MCLQFKKMYAFDSNELSTTTSGALRVTFDWIHIETNPFPVKTTSDRILTLVDKEAEVTIYYRKCSHNTLNYGHHLHNHDGVSVAVTQNPEAIPT